MKSSSGIRTLLLGIVMLSLCCGGGSGKEGNSTNSNPTIGVFNQNEGGQGAYKLGAYDPNAVQPTTFNWTRQSRFAGPRVVKVKWSITLPAGVRVSPVLGNKGEIYIFGGGGYVACVSPTGSIKWEVKASGAEALFEPVITKNNSILVATYGGGINNLGDEMMSEVSSTGTILWTYSPISVQFGSAAIDSDGTIYTSTAAGNLRALTADGQLKWKFLVGGSSVWSAPAIGLDGTIYFGDNGYHFWAVNPDGTQKWVFSAGDWVITSPTLGKGGVIYFGSVDGNFYALDNSGKAKWIFPAGGPIRSSSALDANGTLYFGCGGGNIYAISTDGLLKWKYSTGAADILSSPLIDSEGTLYCGASDFYLYALNSDGTLRWKYKTDGNIEASVAIGTDRTLYIAVGRTLYALGE